MFSSTLRQSRSSLTLRTASCGYVTSASNTLLSMPISIPVSHKEVVSKRLSLKNLELATRALHRDGLVVLENVINHIKLDALNQKMVQDAMVLQSAGDASPFNYNKGNIQQDPPLVKQYWDSDIIINALATQVTASVLGPKPRLSFISGNSAMPPSPGSEPMSQPVHSDADFAHPECPFALVVNVPLVEMNKENGSTEVWLGSHKDASLASQEGAHGDRASGRIRLDLLAERMQQRSPAQPVIKKGSIIIRDLRLWHAGKPNLTDKTRVMLAMIHFAPWFRNMMQVEIAETLVPVLMHDGNDLDIQASFCTEETLLANYLTRGFGNAYAFDQTDRLEGVF